MGDFYHRRSNVLVCTTIIETGIDIPNANTMIIERADKFGLAQLHQLRGRVGRSHRQAYAYLLMPHPKALTEDARKRLEAIEAAGELGVGFTLATHDLEIRGAGELLGEEQSGQIESIGFSLYMDMLDRAVQRDPRRQNAGPRRRRSTPHQEVNLRVPALIPEDYLPDVHTRLILYKRISSAESRDALDELRAEIIDRFGALPVATKTLFRITELRLRGWHRSVSHESTSGRPAAGSNSPPIRASIRLRWCGSCSASPTVTGWRTEPDCASPRSSTTSKRDSSASRSSSNASNRRRKPGWRLRHEQAVQDRMRLRGVVGRLTHSVRMHRVLPDDTWYRVEVIVFERISGRRSREHAGNRRFARVRGRIRST